MSLIERIKTLANKQGISLPTLESELGFGNSTIVKWSKSTPNADKLNKVAEYFGVSMDYLLKGTELNNMQDEAERELIMLCRNASNSDPQAKAELVELFKSTTDVYLKAKGLKK